MFKYVYLLGVASIGMLFISCEEQSNEILFVPESPTHGSTLDSELTLLTNTESETEGAISARLLVVAKTLARTLSETPVDYSQYLSEFGRVPL